MQIPSIKFVFLIVIAMIFWGFSWSSGKFIADKMQPEILLFWRFFLTFISLIPVILYLKKSVRISRKAIKYVVLRGLIMSLYNYFFFEGLKSGLAGAGGVLVTTLNPLLTFFLSSILHRYRPGWKEILGITLGFSGGLIMIHVWNFSLDELFLGGNLFFLLAALSWALISINGQYSGKRLSPLLFSLYVYGISSLLNFIPAVHSGIFSVFSMDLPFWLNLIYLSIVSTTFGTTVYFFAASRYGSRLASSFIFIVPISAVFGSIVFLNEKPDPVVLIGGALALSAVYLINMQKKTANEDMQKISKAA